MAKKLVVGNWKLHGSLVGNRQLLTQLKLSLTTIRQAEIAVCLPYVYLHQAQQLLSDSNIRWGAQNVSQFSEGAFTSCISARMIAEFGCKYSIIGHSERRVLMSESNHVSVKKLMLALQAGLTPIFCVGETLDERNSGLAEVIVKNQMLNIVYGLDEDQFTQAKRLAMVIAYEPVWAIGTGEHAKPQQAQHMHEFIRSCIAARDPDFARDIRIIYGGSVTPKSAQEILQMPDVDGTLVGRASLSADDFSAICQIAQSVALSQVVHTSPVRTINCEMLERPIWASAAL